MNIVGYFRITVSWYHRYDGQNCIVVASTPESYAIILASLNAAKCPNFWCYGKATLTAVDFFKLLHSQIRFINYCHTKRWRKTVLKSTRQGFVILTIWEQFSEINRTFLHSSIKNHALSAIYRFMKNQGEYNIRSEQWWKKHTFTAKDLQNNLMKGGNNISMQSIRITFTRNAVSSCQILLLTKKNINMIKLFSDQLRMFYGVMLTDGNFLDPMISGMSGAHKNSQDL